MSTAFPAVPFAAILVMAGSGERLGAAVPKAFVPLAGRALWLHAAGTLAATPGCVRLVLVTPADRTDEVREAARTFPVPCSVTRGGARRQDSVARGVAALGAEEIEVVAVHDAARPLVTRETILAAVRDAAEHGASLAAAPVRDTVKEADGTGFVSGTADRSRLWLAQTPQCFRPEVLERAHREGRERGLEVTDDAALAEALGLRVRITRSSAWNFKITEPEDLRVAEARLRLEGGGS